MAPSLVDLLVGSVKESTTSAFNSCADWWLLSRLAFQLELAGSAGSSCGVEDANGPALSNSPLRKCFATKHLRKGGHVVKRSD